MKLCIYARNKKLFRKSIGSSCRVFLSLNALAFRLNGPSRGFKSACLGPKIPRQPFAANFRNSL